jgi:signal peptidase I
MSSFLNINSPENPQHNTSIKKQYKRNNKDGWTSILSTVAILLAAPIIAIFITAFVFQSYQVDGSSMETTLHDRDRLIVWKLGKTWSNLMGDTYKPDRGDIVIFSTPALASIGQDPQRQLIKRVIGLPGERIVIRDGTVTIYNKEHPTGFQPDKTLPYGEAISITSGDIDMVIPKGKVFVCGDNRDYSLDSRIKSIGPIDVENIIGKLAIRVWPVNSAKVF